jgi:hypothetical protein
MFFGVPHFVQKFPTIGSPQAVQKALIEIPNNLFS